MDLKKFDFKKLKHYTSPQAIKDIDRFLDGLPVMVGYNVLIAAGIAWILAGAAVLFATSEASKVADLRAQMLEVESLRPPVPEIQFLPVSKAALQKFVDDVERVDLYPILNFKTGNDGELTISGKNNEFTALTYALGHVMGSGRNWHVSFDQFCIGSECTAGKMEAKLKVSVIRIADAKQATGTAATGED